VYIFYQIFHFLSKNNLNFELYENMLTILYFIFLYHKLQLCFRCHVRYTHLRVVKDSWNLKNLFNRFNFFLNFKFHNFQIVSVFWMGVINQHHLNFFPIKIPLLKESLTLGFTKLTTCDAIVVHLQKSFIKTKI
jgi:hypothetical protein